MRLEIDSLGRQDECQGRTNKAQETTKNFNKFFFINVTCRLHCPASKELSIIKSTWEKWTLIIALEKKMPSHCTLGKARSVEWREYLKMNLERKYNARKSCVFESVHNI